MKSYPLLIDGKEEEGTGWTYVLKASSLIKDPMSAFNLKRGLETGEISEYGEDAGVVGRCAYGDRDHNTRAVDAAARAAREFSRFSIEQMKDIADDIRNALHERRDEFVEILIAEGHPRRLAEWEVEGVIHGGDHKTIGWSFDQMRESHTVDGREILFVRRPDGVVCLNPPQNAAGSNCVLGVPALLAGNTLVVKAPRTTPLSVMFIYHDLVQPVLEKHGAPKGTLNLISGDTRSILKQWIKNPKVDDIFFFGDSQVGLKIGRECIENDKKPLLELAGNDGFVVWHDADLENAAMALAESFYGSGQICMVPKYAIVHPQVADEFTALMQEQVAAMKPGYPEDPDTVLSPVLKADKFWDFLSQAREAGCEILAGGRKIDVDGNETMEGFFFEPTLIEVNGFELADTLSCVREETFFPMLPLVIPTLGQSDETLAEEVLDFMNANRYGLRNSLWTADPSLIDRFVAGLSNGGQIKVNESHIGFSPYLSTHGGNDYTGGPFGELNYPMLRTSHLQGISITPHGTPLDSPGASVQSSSKA